MISVLVFLLFSCFILGFVFLYLYYSLNAQRLGAPLVLTEQKYIEQILKAAKLTNKDFLIDLGSGDGRVLSAASKQYGVTGFGVEINPFLVLYSNLLARLNGANIYFKRGDLSKTNLDKATVIYLFLYPKIIKKLSPKLKNKIAEGTIIISRGFKLDGLDNKIYLTLDTGFFPTYFYKNNG